MSFIRVYSWKPTGSLNFGDEIGPMIVKRMCNLVGNDTEVQSTTASAQKKMLAVGSILHEAKAGDVVWGAGLNSKHRFAVPKESKIVFRAVRGPLTRATLQDSGHDCPPIYGDPGLLFPMLFDETVRRRRGELEIAASKLGMKMPHTIFIPNINDDRFLPYFSSQGVDCDFMYVRPSLDPITVAAYISASSRVISSSLHGLVFADAYRRSTTRIISQYEPEFKYSDYYLGTGRTTPPAFPDVKSALAGPEITKLEWDPTELIDAFPGTDRKIIEALSVKLFGIEPGVTHLVKDCVAEQTPFGEGWSQPEDRSLWSTATWAQFNFVAKGPIGSGALLRMQVGTLAKGRGDFELVRVVHAGKLIYSEKIKRTGESTVLAVPLPATEKGQEINLSFKFENASQPKQYFTSADGRLLGMWVSQFGVFEADA